MWVHREYECKTEEDSNVKIWLLLLVKMPSAKQSFELPKAQNKLGLDWLKAV